MERLGTPTSGPLRAKPRPEDALPPLPTLPVGEAGYTPTSGPLTAQPTPPAPPPPIPPPAAVPGRIAAPTLGPMVDNGGIATHDPTQAIPPPAPVAIPFDAPAPPPIPHGGPLPDGTDAPAPPPIPHGGPTEYHADGGPTPVDPATVEPPTLDTKFRDALMQMLDLQDPSMSDPALAAQSGAFGVQQQRAKERARNAMAERFAADGGAGVDSGAFDSGIVGLEQAQGEAQGAHDAGLLANELEARRNQLVQGAALAGAQMSEEDRLAFQREFAQINADLEKARLAQQGSQFDRSLDEQGSQFDRQFGLEGRRLDEQGRQFDQSYGLESQRFDEARRQFDASFAESAKQFEANYGLEGKRLAETIRQFDVGTAAGQDQLKQQLEIFKASQEQQGRQFDVDAELRRMGIDSQTALGGQDLALRDKLGSGSLLMQYLQALIGNSNFKDNLGANIGMFNQKSLLELLGMA